MQSHHALAACVLLAVVICASCEDTTAESRSSFADWLAGKQQSTAPNKVATQSMPTYAYERRQVAHTCLKAGGIKNCRLPETGTVGLEYFEVGAQCCDAKSTIGYSAFEVGTCKFNEYYFNAPINEASSVSKLGEFTVQCNMNAASDTCGHPFCDQMVQTASGGIYYTDEVVIASDPSAPSVEQPACPTDKCGDKFELAAQRMKRPAAGGGDSGAAGAGAGSKVDGTVKTASVAARPAGYGYNRAPSHLKSGKAIIYFGPMTVNSRVHDIKVTQGWFEFVACTEAGGEVTEEQAEGKHVVDPYTFNLEFYKPQVY